MSVLFLFESDSCVKHLASYGQFQPWKGHRGLMLPVKDFFPLFRFVQGGRLEEADVRCLDLTRPLITHHGQIKHCMMSNSPRPFLRFSKNPWISNPPASFQPMPSGPKKQKPSQSRWGMNPRVGRVITAESDDARVGVSLPSILHHLST